MESTVDLVHADVDGSSQILDATDATESPYPKYEIELGKQSFGINTILPKVFFDSKCSEQILECDFTSGIQVSELIDWIHFSFKSTSSGNLLIIIFNIFNENH